MKNEMPSPGDAKFPSGFLWGSATSSYQVEGGIENCDWARGAREGKVPPAGKACDHYHLYEKDFDIAKSLRHNVHRFSIEWSRIEPQEGNFNDAEIEHYRSVLRALHARGLEPFVTLWHSTLPMWFEDMGGFENRKAVAIFARYCVYVIEKLGMEAKYWITINEPLVWASGGYRIAKWPPFQKNFYKFLFVSEALISAHIAAYKAMKKIAPGIQIGIAKHNIFFDADGKVWNKVLAAISRYFWNRRFLWKINAYQDFIGLNFYIHGRFGKRDECSKTEMGWDNLPIGIYHVLSELKRFKKPIYITENGISDAADKDRATYIQEHLRYVLQAIHEGLPVRGYFYWSLLDNFEWSFGYTRRFGLVKINFDTLERTIRPSAFVYKKICETNSL